MVAGETANSAANASTCTEPCEPSRSTMAVTRSARRNVFGILSPSEVRILECSFARHPWTADQERAYGRRVSFTMDEIRSQPMTWRRAVERFDTVAGALAAPGERVLAIGC